MSDPCNHSHGFTFLDRDVKKCNRCGAVFVIGKLNGWPTWKEAK